jgi:hypothetical protein
LLCVRIFIKIYSTAQQLNSSTAQQLNSSTAQQLNSSTAQQLNSSKFIYSATQYQLSDYSMELINRSVVAIGYKKSHSENMPKPISLAPIATR